MQDKKTKNMLAITSVSGKNLPAQPDGERQLGLDQPSEEYEAKLVSSGRFHLTDEGNAQMLVALFGNRIRYCFDWKFWLFWDGARWTRDNLGIADRCAKETTKAIWFKAMKNEDPDKRKALMSHALKTEHDQRRKAMISAAHPWPTELAICRKTGS